MNEINEKTKVGLFAVLGSLPILLGGMLWLTSIDAKASSAKSQIEGAIDLLMDVRERVIRIEERQKKYVKE